jgi:hypothetical protein
MFATLLSDSCAGPITWGQIYETGVHLRPIILNRSGREEAVSFYFKFANEILYNTLR